MSGAAQSLEISSTASPDIREISFDELDEVAGGFFMLVVAVGFGLFLGGAVIGAIVAKH